MGLNDATVFLFRTDLRGVSGISNTATTLRFSGVTATCGTNRVRVRDVAEGGDFYPFPGGLDIKLATPCGVRVGGTSSTGGGGAIAGAPELQPIIGAPVFRHIAPNRKVANAFYQGMFAQATTAIVKTITVGDLVWGAKNAGAATTIPFRIRLLRAGVQVAEQNLANGLKAGEDTTFTFDRGTQAQTEVARLALVPNASTVQIYKATGGECVQTVGQSTQFDWQDPSWEIRVDPLQAVTTETNRSNNNKTF
ncbi:MAG TPA: hypothetical protein VJB15_11270 [Rhodothermia bacterium]|nr:hypothetical protein [Rhodothermia bacterium]